MYGRDLTLRTLTDLYNQFPTWLQNAHAAIVLAVLDAYGWNSDVTNAEVLHRLLDLNGERGCFGEMVADAEQDGEDDEQDEDLDDEV